MNEKKAKRVRKALRIAIKHDVEPVWAEAVLTAAGVTPREARRALDVVLRRSK